MAKKEKHFADIIPFPGKDQTGECVLLHCYDGPQIVPHAAIRRILNGTIPLSDPEMEPVILRIIEEWFEWQVDEE